MLLVCTNLGEGASENQQGLPCIMGSPLVMTCRGVNPVARVRIITTEEERGAPGKRHQDKASGSTLRRKSGKSLSSVESGKCSDTKEGQYSAERQQNLSWRGRAYGWWFSHWFIFNLIIFWSFQDIENLRLTRKPVAKAKSCITLSMRSSVHALFALLLGTFVCRHAKTQYD